MFIIAKCGGGVNAGNKAEKKEENIKRLREYLNSSSLTMLQKQDVTGRFKRFVSTVDVQDVIRTNAILHEELNNILEGDFESSFDQTLSL